VSTGYDYRLIRSRLELLLSSTEPLLLVNLLRSGLLRNLGNITNTALFNRSYVGTKLLISEYITAVVSALDYIAALPPSASFPAQAKFDFIQDTRQSFGRTALVLQGGGQVFGLCHLGVVKALHHQSLLPRIITGTAEAGALVAALVGVHSESELPGFLESQDLAALSFGDNRTFRIGIDIAVLRSYVSEHVGDQTFYDAYDRTKRILNITLPGKGVLNYLTTPNVLIRTAASSSDENQHLLCRNIDGEIVSWVQDLSARPDPHTRITELFNVNHFLISQGRPYLAPLLSSDLHRHRRRGLYLKVLRLMGMEVTHILRQLDTLGVLPGGLRGFLVEPVAMGGGEGLVSAGDGAAITIVPHLGYTDIQHLIGNGGRGKTDYWVQKGMRSVWGAMELIRTALRVEVELDRLYWVLKNRVENNETQVMVAKTGRRMGREKRERRPSG
jgi:TAG lipase/lysophosphatidylethanolamine acyltransferase